MVHFWRIVRLEHECSQSAHSSCLECLQIMLIIVLYIYNYYTSGLPTSCFVGMTRWRAFVCRPKVRELWTRNIRDFGHLEKKARNVREPIGCCPVVSPSGDPPPLSFFLSFFLSKIVINFISIPGISGIPITVFL